jgi:Bifunctional DNA primase/polymerase, N-terminal
MTAAPISKMDFAHDAARRGFSVFLLEAGTNLPLMPTWREVATPDPDQIRECWALCPDANVGISVKNLLTLRVTELCPPETFKPLAALLREREVPPSVRTVRGRPNKGIEICLCFLIPVGATVEAKSDVLFAGIDVLSNEDFVVGPGSVMDGDMCKFADNNCLSQASPWLMEVCGVQLAEVEKVKPLAATVLKTVAPVSRKDAALNAATATLAPVSKEAAARDAIARGFSLIPLKAFSHPGPNATEKELELAVKKAKSPMINNWQNEATTCAATFSQWFKAWPEANMGGTTDDKLVIDIDPRNGGEATFEFLQMVNDFPDTAESNTQSGGKHLIYVLPHGVRVKGGAHKLGPGVDVKSRGGYIALPGSVIDGRPYTWANDRPIALAPQWMIDVCKAAKAKGDNAGKRLVEEDDIAIEMATDWMRDHAPTAEYGVIDDTTFIVATECFDYGVSLDTAIELVQNWNETRCNPPGDEDRLLVVVESAMVNRDSPIGCKHPKAGFEVVEIAERPAPPVAGIPTAKIGDAGAWENEPNAIFVDHLKPADLPAGVLPELVEQFARDRARRLGVDAGAPAAALVTALGSLVPAGNRLQMRQLDTEWTVKPILWTAIIGPPRLEQVGNHQRRDGTGAKTAERVAEIICRRRAQAQDGRNAPRNGRKGSQGQAGKH